MNVQLNPEQFLAVYNSITSIASIEAKEVKIKMESVILEALTIIDDSSNQSKFSHWMKKEKEKLNALEDQLKLIKEPINDGLYPTPTSLKDEK